MKTEESIKKLGKEMRCAEIDRRRFLKRSGGVSFASILGLSSSRAVLETHPSSGLGSCTTTCVHTADVVGISIIGAEPALPGPMGQEREKINVEVEVHVSNLCECDGDGICYGPDNDEPFKFSLEFATFASQDIQGGDVLPPGVSDDDVDGDGAPNGIDAENDVFDNPSCVSTKTFSNNTIGKPNGVECGYDEVLFFELSFIVEKGSPVGVWEVDGENVVPGGATDPPRPSDSFPPGFSLASPSLRIEDLKLPGDFTLVDTVAV